MCLNDHWSSDTNDCCVLQCCAAIFFLCLAIYAVTKIFAGYARPLNRYGYFGRRGPLEWSRIYPFAMGNRQSPINIISDEVCCVYPSAETINFPLTFHLYDKIPLQLSLFNDGFKAILTGKWNEMDLPYLTGGPLGCSKFFFVGLTFRWGPTDSWGSEHMLNYRRYPLELQLIHAKMGPQPPADEQCSSRNCDTICMVSYFFKIVEHDNQYLNPIIHKLGRIENVSSKVCLQPFPLQWLVHPFSHEYFTYPGSLTDPPCTESAIWLLKFHPTICISKAQLELFRRLRSSEGPIIVNSRPVQNLNGRAVCYYAKE